MTIAVLLQCLRCGQRLSSGETYAETDCIDGQSHEWPSARPFSGACVRCKETEHDDTSLVTWRCCVCEAFTCRNCTLTIPRSVPTEYYWQTFCSQRCWIAAGSPKE